MTHAAVVVRKARDRGIALRVTDGQLRYAGPAGALTSQLKAELVESKPEVLALLQGEEQQRRDTVMAAFRGMYQRLVVIAGPNRGIRNATSRLVAAFDTAEHEADRAAQAYIRGEVTAHDVFLRALRNMEAAGVSALMACGACGLDDLTVTVAMDDGSRLCARALEGCDK